MTKIIQTEQPAKFKLEVDSFRQIKERVSKELDLPYFFQHEDAFYKIISNNEILVVRVSMSWVSIVKSIPSTFRNEIATGIPRLDFEFEQAFQTALSKIQNL